jgi:REP element-mobilizing transposase RayT
MDEANAPLERTRHALRATGVKEMDHPLRSGIHTRGYLPHVKREGAWYFVTFRLADALPKEVLLRFEAERADAKRRVNSAMESLPEIEREFRRKVERYLDNGHGACDLGTPEIAELVSNGITFFDGSRYVLADWVVMPNHVHVVLCPMPNNELSGILKSLKQFTSRQAKRLLNLGDAPFWQPESYDHWIRSEEEKARIGQYIRANPVKGGLCKAPEDWRWSSAGGFVAQKTLSVAQTSSSVAQTSESAVSQVSKPANASR